ncbi:hypothetical protein [Streptomyces sp. C]|uniref:hypothetical protein n=1 Tax=Streptomyces sp. C TaxID=253839 RepID=UPI0001B4CE1B|nr:hypothetical protein [Streptomyces sp. C]EFL19700.1 predicted protein [Streptomyces sp. C]
MGTKDETGKPAGADREGVGPGKAGAPQRRSESRDKLRERQEKDRRDSFDELLDELDHRT